MKIRIHIFKIVAVGLLIFNVAFATGMAGKDKPHKDKFYKSPKDNKFGHNKDEFKHPPKNVIIFIADGAGFNHFKTADFYQCGQTPCQACEDFPVQLAVSTYPAGGSYDANLAWKSFNYVENDPTDSAAAATALSTGVKTYNAGIGVDVDGNPVPNLLERAEQLGKSTGVVTSVPFSHATPAAFVVHNTDRDNYKHIAADMVNKSAADVIFGCGHPLYDENAKPKLLHDYKYIDSKDFADLSAGSAGADADGDGVSDPWILIQTRAEFQVLAKGPTPKRVFGLVQVAATLQKDRSGSESAAPFEIPLTQAVPTLEEMTAAALNVLDDDPDGFFIMIEGGAVDWASHDNHAGRLVEEMIDFNKAIEIVLHWIEQKSNWGETLVIITADHETGYLTGPDSGQALFGDTPVFNDLVCNGPGKLPSLEWHSGGHTNSLVPFFAKGRNVQLFKTAAEGLDPVRGPYIDNTDIAGVIFSLWRD